MPSLLRDFSAPVKMTVEGQSDDDLVFLFANDSDPFNRWDAGQRLAMKLVHSLYHAAAKANADPASEAAVAAACGAAGGVSDALVNAFRSVLTAGDLDGSFKVGVFGGGAYVCVCVCVRSVCGWVWRRWRAAASLWSVRVAAPLRGRRLYHRLKPSTNLCSNTPTPHHQQHHNNQSHQQQPITSQQQSHHNNQHHQPRRWP